MRNPETQRGEGRDLLKVIQLPSGEPGHKSSSEACAVGHWATLPIRGISALLTMPGTGGLGLQEGRSLQGASLDSGTN